VVVEVAEDPVSLEVVAHAARMVVRGPVGSDLARRIGILLRRTLVQTVLAVVSVDLTGVTILDPEAAIELAQFETVARRVGMRLVINANSAVAQQLRTAGLTFQATGEPTPQAGAGSLTAQIAGTTPAAGHIRPLSPLPVDAVPLLVAPFDQASLRPVRQRVRAITTQYFSSHEGQYEILLAVAELMANTVCHGGGHGSVRLWLAGTDLWAQVSDRGPGIPVHRLHLPRPVLGDSHGWGLWVVRRIAASVDIATSSAGTIVRLRYPISPS
jgi:serine/threonine-protein kinase RsbW